ncbi:hypothetical protein [Rhodococcus qingshengii]|uniref:hypothetical protein n=1 Tax=Rhodococcus qingshengii TaxID=334542 RepID=UPI0035E1C182
MREEFCHAGLARIETASLVFISTGIVRSSSWSAARPHHGERRSISDRRGWMRNLIKVAVAPSRVTKRREAATYMSDSVAHDGSVSTWYPSGRMCRLVGYLEVTDGFMIVLS